MPIKIPYGKKEIVLETKEKYSILNPCKIDIKDKNEVIDEGFFKPIDSISFEEFASNSEKLLIIVNDGTRPTPTATIIEYLSPILSNHPDVAFLVACGSHRAPTEDEFKFIFGKCYDKMKDKIYVHDAKNSDEIRYIGNSSNGNKIGFNKKLFEYKNVVAINSVEPHYFAGYTGGRKSFLPGVAAYDTIEYNHKHALDEEACCLALHDNPIHEDMTESVNMLKDINIFSIQIVLTPENKLFKITTGNLEKSFQKAVEYANDIFCTPLKNKGNIVITVAPPPLDINLYQAQKAIENGKIALEKNGIIILLADCPKGIGPEKFMNLLSSAETADEVMDKIKKEYKLGYHKAAKIADLCTWADIYAVTSIDDEIIKKAFLKPFSNLQKALDDAVEKIKKKGETPEIIVLPYGSLTVPFIQDS